MFNCCPFNYDRPNVPLQGKKPMNPQAQQSPFPPNFPVMPPPFEQPPSGTITTGSTASPHSPGAQEGSAQQAAQHAAPTTPISGPVFFENLPQTPVMSSEYTQGFLQTQIGKRVKITFLVGNTITLDRSGVLTDVGINYVILTETNTGNRVLCDLFSIKFVLFYM